MEIFSWRNIAALLAGGALAGLIFGAFQYYQSQKRENIALSLHKAEKLLSQNKTAEVEKLLKEIPSPSRGYILLQLGDFYFSQGKLKEAAEKFHKAFKTFSESDKPLSYYSLEKEAYIYYRLGEYRKSLNLLGQLPEDAPNFCSAQLLLAEDYIGLKRFKEAADSLLRITQVCNGANIQMTAKYLLQSLKGEKG